MNQNLIQNQQEVWLKVLGKGLLTLPKKWRDEFGLKSGSLVKARKQGNKIVVEPAQTNQSTAPYRIYSQSEIAEFLKDDSIL